MTDPSVDAPTDLARYWEVPRRRWRVVAAVTLVGVVGVVAYTQLAPRSYTGTAVVTIDAISSTPFDQTKSVDQLVSPSTEAQVAASDPVAVAAAKMVKPAGVPSAMQGNLSVGSTSGTATLTFTYKTDGAPAAAAGANAFARAYLAYRRDQAVAQQQQQLAAIKSTLANLNIELAAANGTAASGNPGSALVQAAIASRAQLGQQIADLSTKQNDLATMPITPGAIARQATPPTSPTWPKRKLLLAGGALLSLLLGLVLAFVRDRLDGRIRGRRDLETAGAGAVLAEIPRRRQRRAAPRIAAVDAPEGAESEGYRRLHATLLHALRAHERTVIAVVGECRLGDANGPAANIAVNLALAGNPVALVLPSCSDATIEGFSASLQLARPDADLPDVLAGAPISRAIANSARVTDLAVIYGRAAADAGQSLLAGKRLDALIAQLRERGGYVVLDGSAPLNRSQAVALATLADAVIVVAEARSTQRAMVASLAEELAQVGDLPVGCALIRSPRAGDERSSRRRLARPDVRAAAPQRPLDEPGDAPAIGETATSSPLHSNEPARAAGK